MTRIGIVAIAALALPASAAGATVDVARVIDGDTIRVRDNDRAWNVDLLGIDAPDRGACGASEAKRALRRLLPHGTAVTLVRDANAHKTARYVYRGHRLVNRSLLAAGRAKTAATRGLKLARRLTSAEHAAQAAHRGIWQQCATTPPPAPGTPAGPTAIERARTDLAGRSFSKLTASLFSSSEIRLHLCSDGRYIQDSTYDSDFGGHELSRDTGRWDITDAIANGSTLPPASRAPGKPVLVRLHEARSAAWSTVSLIRSRIATCEHLREETRRDWLSALPDHQRSLGWLRDEETSAAGTALRGELTRESDSAARFTARAHESLRLLKSFVETRAST